MKLTILIALLCLIFIKTVSNSQSIQSLNFEGGGYVTEIYAPDIIQPLLYCRTDIGGVYRIHYEGGDWEFISQQFNTTGGLMVQGLAHRSANDPSPNFLAICVGNDFNSSDQGKGVWITSNAQNGNPVTWTKTLDINFGGNQFDLKRGGECITFDNNIPGSNVLYVGGINSGIYTSVNSGQSWTQIASSGQVAGSVVSVAVQPGNSNVLWVGTSVGLYHGTFSVVGWTWSRIAQNDINNLVFRVLPVEDGLPYVAFKSDNIDFGLCRINSDLNSVDNLTDDFNSGLSSSAGYFCTVRINIDGALLASRTIRPTRISYDGGSSWQTLDLNLDLQYNPKHALSSKSGIFDGKNNFTQHSYTYIPFSSGGAGPYMGDGFTGTWRYMVNGINMPVIYDIAIDPFSSKGNYNMYFPLSDWTMARSQNNILPQMFDYSRQGTYESTYEDTYIPNVTRALISPAATSRVYMIGGSVYNYYAAMCKMDLSQKSLDAADSYTKMTNNGLPLYFQPDRTIIDGVISSDFNDPNPETRDKMVVLVGGKDKILINGFTTLGVFYSTNSGNTFSNSSFSTNFNTQQRYFQSFADGLFSKQFNLANHPFNSSYKYLYLENGGFFASSNLGASWEWLSDPPVNYLDEGCLKVVSDETFTLRFYLAVKNRGFYRKSEVTPLGNSSWSAVNGGWTSAEEVDVLGNTIIVFGKRNSDTQNKLYYSTNDGATWTAITDPFTNQIGSIPSTRCLKIDMHQPNVVYIGTGGQGVFKYVINNNDDDDNAISSNQIGSSNYPNPFNPKTTISFSLPNDSRVRIVVYDLTGRVVKELLNSRLKSGEHKVEFDASNLASGIYLYRFVSDNYSEVKKMILVK